MNIFKVNIFTYIFYLILILCGYINYLVIMLLIMIAHELGHIIVIKLLHYKIEKIVIYPFGGVINTNIDFNIKSFHLFIISIAGILMQILLLLIIQNDGSNNYLIFKNLNISLIIYNLLPIYPLDGYKVMLSIIEKYASYRFIIILSIIISLTFLFIYLAFTKSLYVFIILYYLNIIYLSNYAYILNKFFLERHIYGIKYKKAKIINKENNVYKNYHNYIYKDKKLISEEIFSKFNQLY